MTRIINLFLIGSLIITSKGLTKSETVTANVSEAVEDPKYSPRLFEGKIASMVECVRLKIKDGITLLTIGKIPIKKSLDPLKIRIPIPLKFRKINSDIVSGKLTLKKFNLEGLAGFELIKGSVSATKTVTFVLNFKKIKLTSTYKAKLTLFGIMDIYGKGTLDIELNNFHIDTKVKVKTLPNLRLTDLFLNITLPATNGIITGLLEDEYMSDLISRQLTDTLTTLAEEEHVRFNTILSDAATSFIENIVNPALKNLSISDLLAILGGLSTNCEEPLLNLVETAMTFIMDLGGIDSDLVFSDDGVQYEDDEFINKIR